MVEQAENILQNLEVQRISSLLSSQGWSIDSVDLSGNRITLKISKLNIKEPLEDRQ